MSENGEGKFLFKYNAEIANEITTAQYISKTVWFWS